MNSRLATAAALSLALGSPVLRAAPQTAARIDGRVIDVDPLDSAVIVQPSDGGAPVKVTVEGQTAVSKDLEQRITEGQEVRAAYEPGTGRALSMTLVEEPPSWTPSGKWFSGVPPPQEMGYWLRNREEFDPGFSVYHTPMGE